MSYNIAVATSDGEIVDTHFGHAGEFLIIRVNEQDGSYEEVEERHVSALCFEKSRSEDEHMQDAEVQETSCNQQGNSEQCGTAAMQEIAKQLRDVEFVLCAKIGTQAIRALARYDITTLDAVMPINRAVHKINQYRERYHAKRKAMAEQEKNNAGDSRT